MPADTQYPDHFIERLHAVWGEGFLSPGGAEEVAEILRGIDLHGKTVLDVGFGTGGPAIVLAGQLGAEKVIGIDVEEAVYERASKAVQAAGLASRIDLRIVEPGPLPFEDDSLDVVFSKDSIIHIPDKQRFFEDVFRILRPGGIFAASDWLCGTGPEAEAAIEEMLATNPLRFKMATAQDMANTLTQTGFANVSTVDRNAWYAEQVQEELRQLTGPLYADLVAKVGKEIVDPWLTVRRGTAKATIAGGLRPTHLRAVKPTD
ncbi:methyltransferase domain-containing protein [Hwanghaeella grinnelliae]|uniref:Methyltransferase domain-containing protein n=1 Tax=Hwanghaeella grinnelliae TaxID=2500179 RepID=A0A437QHK5_9PROT|nr:methyltransferase domain-containing protein [Hwanghaeella grinnelliae]RVU33800.1 methyltransferase domain-containing protein [Hwanghaeella grinnelliae]